MVNLVPYTTEGRTAWILVIVVGLYGYTHIIEIILQALQHKFEEEERGQDSVNFDDHAVIC